MFQEQPKKDILANNASLLFSAIEKLPAAEFLAFINQYTTEEISAAVCTARAVYYSGGETPLHTAVKSNPEAFRILVDKASAAAVDAVLVYADGEGYTPLHHAARNESGKLNAAAFQVLVDKASVAAIDRALVMVVHNGWTCFHLASRYLHAASFQALVGKASVAAIDRALVMATTNGWTPLHLAANYLDPVSFQILVRKADPVAIDRVVRETVIERAPSASKVLLQHLRANGVKIIMGVYADLLVINPKDLEVYLWRGEDCLALAADEKNSLVQREMFYRDAYKDFKAVLMQDPSFQIAQARAKEIEFKLEELAGRKQQEQSAERELEKQREIGAKQQEQAGKTEEIKKGLAELRSKWQTDPPRVIVAAYEKLVAQNPKLIEIYYERGSFFAAMGDKMSLAVQKQALYQKAQVDLLRVVTEDPFHTEAAELLEKVAQKMQAVAPLGAASAVEMPYKQLDKLDSGATQGGAAAGAAGAAAQTQRFFVAPRGEEVSGGKPPQP